MPDREIDLIVNGPSTELRRPGWSALRIASSFRAAALTYRRFPDDVCRPVFTEADLPGGVWQEPDSGYMMLRPSPLRDDFQENAAFYAARIVLADLLTPPDWTAGGVTAAYFDEPPGPRTGKQKLITLHKPDVDAIVPSVGGVPAPLLAKAAEGSLAVVAYTADPLRVNEGFSFTLLPQNLPSDRAAAWFGVGFGGRFYLQVGMNGTAALYEYGVADCQDDATWVRRARFEFAQGAADDQPFQVTVIPWGIESLTFLFSQARQSKRPPRGNSAKTAINSYTYQLSKASGDLPPYDEALGHYVKVDPGQLYVAMRKANYHYSFAISKVRYLAASATMLPETLDAPKPIATPDVRAFGFEPSGATMLCSVQNEDGSPWDPETHVRFVPTVALTPGGSGAYSPEVWGLQMEIPAETFETGDASTDFSAYWTSLRWRETVAPDASDLTVVLRRDGDVAALLKRDARVAVHIDGTPRVQGYIREARPHFDGARTTLRDQWACDDAWDRLNGCSAAYFKSFTQMSIGDLLYALLTRAGTPDNEIEIDDELYDVEVGGFVKESDFKTPTEESTVGDVVRDLVRTYALQGRRSLRVRRSRGRWKCYLAPAYVAPSDLGDDGTTPDVVFLMQTDYRQAYLMPDRDRYLATPPLLHVLTQPEVYVRRCDFNDASFFAADQPNEQAGLVACFIAPDPATLDDPAHVDYEGRSRPRAFGPQEVGHVTSQNGLERRARKTYDDARGKQRLWTFAGEWQPVVEPDQFAVIVGFDADDRQVSYGLWRIEEAEISVEHDQVPDDVGLDRRWSWGADYVLSFVAPIDYDGLPFFSDAYRPGVIL